MLNFGGWQIEREVLEIMPESIARESLVLPLEYSGGTLTLLTIDRGAELQDLVSKLQFILNKDIICRFADSETVRGAIDGFYRLAATLVTRCQTRIANSCSRLWLELTETSNPDERNCGDCNRTVYLCRTDEDAAHHAELGNCAALQIGSVEAVETMGLVEFTFQDTTRFYADTPEMLKLYDEFRNTDATDSDHH